MKSNLVDALRRAQEQKSETNLSDSGSFDSTQQDFEAPANQDMADAGFGEDATELELMSTTRGLAVNDMADAPTAEDVAEDDGDSMPAQFGETMASATVLLTASDCVIPGSRSLPSMPKIARHVPALCLVLAIIAGAGWQAYQRLELRQDASALGAFAVPSQTSDQQQEIVLADELEVRFRYLSGPLTTSGDEAGR